MTQAESRIDAASRAGFIGKWGYYPEVMFAWGLTQNPRFGSRLGESDKAIIDNPQEIVGANLGLRELFMALVFELRQISPLGWVQTPVPSDNQFPGYLPVDIRPKRAHTPVVCRPVTKNPNALRCCRSHSTC